MLISREEKKISWFSNLFNKVLKQGVIPRHIGIIMDGNRRFARRKHLNTAEGHEKGMDSLFDTLFWCQDLGITEVTVYAFSLENFKRSQEEVDCLMELAYDKFSHILDDKEKLDEYGLSIRFIGRLELLPLRLQHTLAKVIKETKHNTRCYLNVCIAYTSQDEIATSVNDISEALRSNTLLHSDVDETLITRTLSLSSEVDLLIRTSGEIRLSDFLLWQSSYGALAFLDVLWPDFSMYHLNLAVLYYQFYYDDLKRARDLHEKQLKKIKYDLDLATLNGETSTLNEFRENKEKRIKEFLTNLNIKRDNFINNLLL